MGGGFRGLVLGLALLAAPAALPTDGLAQQRITFCVGEENLPLSSHSPSTPGYEVEIARALARELGAEAAFTWVDLAHGTLEDGVREGRCDVATGVLVDPGPFAAAADLRGLETTCPYYATGYTLLRRAGSPAPRTLEELGEERIAVEGESIATFTLRQRGRRVYVVPDLHAVLRAVDEARAKFGYAWAPRAAWAVRDRMDVVVTPPLAGGDSWSFAMAVRAGSPLRARLDPGIRALRERGAVAEELGRYGLELTRVAGTSCPDASDEGQPSPNASASRR